NAVFVRGDAVGELMFYGRGAGRLPTASAVVADIVDAAQNLRRQVSGRLSAPPATRPVRHINETISRYYIHTKVVDRPGVLASIAAAFGHEDVSIESFIQKGRRADPVSLVFVTHEAQERRVRAALEQISLLPVVRAVANVMRVEGD
ncbi:MAG TPA: ACT domain-containing protein, partial [Limnochordia bacterium]